MPAVFNVTSKIKTVTLKQDLWFKSQGTALKSVFKIWFARFGHNKNI